jgi:hypothetical protein
MLGAVGCLPRGESPRHRGHTENIQNFANESSRKCGPTRPLWIRLDVSEYYVIRTITIFDSSAGGAGFEDIARVLNPCLAGAALLLVELK